MSSADCVPTEEEAIAVSSVLLCLIRPLDWKVVALMIALRHTLHFQHPAKLKESYLIHP